MDISKYPLHKLTQFISAIIPGFFAILLFWLAHPHSLDWISQTGFLGYRTRLTIAVLSCFVLGFTLTAIVSGIAGGIGGLVGAVQARRPYQPPHTIKTAPWRDPVWRTALKKVLGGDAPDDTQPMSEEIFKMREEFLRQVPNDYQRNLIDLQQEKLKSEIDDSRWQGWYEQYHQIAIGKRYNDAPFQIAINQSLQFSLQTTGLVLVVGIYFVPAIRHWWCIVPASFWVLTAIGQTYYALKAYSNRWSTRAEQIEYLSSVVVGQKAQAQNA